MKKQFFPFLALVFATLACIITPTPTSQPPAPTEPPGTEPPVPTEPPQVTNTTCNEVSLYLDPVLASNVICETMPQSPYEMQMYPEHTEVTLVGYPLADKKFEPHISIYPVAAYTALLPTVIPDRVASLQAITNSGVIPPFVFSSTHILPFLPTFNAAQAFYAQAQVLPFASGDGIRFLPVFTQFIPMAINTDLFYTYQGLTDDGQYWVSAILPINHPMLPADASNPPEGYTWEGIPDNYETYVNDMADQLNTLPEGSFLPAITALDALVSSITITP